MAKLVIGNTKTNGVPAVIVGSVPNITALSVTPTTSAQSITATGGVDGYSPVNVSAVDNTIDANITAGNIKSGVTILGVTGTLPTVSEPYLEYMVSAGKLQNSTTTSHVIDINGATDVKEFVLANAYMNNPNINSKVDLSSLTQVSGQYALYGAFSSCSVPEIDLSSLTTISGTNACRSMCSSAAYLASIDLTALTTISGDNGCTSMFYNCWYLQSIDLSSLTSITGQYACRGMFTDSALASIDLSGLTTMLGYNCCQEMFYRCTHLTTVTFTSLYNVSQGGVLQNAFQACSGLQSLYFPALTSTSFGNYNNQFSGMLTNCSGVTVHFPSNLDPAGGSTVISSKSGYPNFGGSNITLAFDLTATS